MKIKRLEAKDIQYKDAINEVSGLKMNDDLFHKFVSNPNNLAYYILKDDKVIAFAYGYILERLDKNPMLYIHSVDVLKDYQSQGLGSLLLKAFLDFAKEEKLRNTFLITDKGNIPANKLYKKFTKEIFEDKVLYVFK